MPNSTAEIVGSIIRAEETLVANSWKHPERRLGLLEICRAIDSVALGAQSNQKVFDFWSEGANKAISLYMGPSCNEQRTPLFPSNDKTFQWAHSVVHHCGRIAVCEKLLDYERAGLGRFSEQDDYERRSKCMVRRLVASEK